MPPITKRHKKHSSAGGDSPNNRSQGSSRRGSVAHDYGGSEGAADSGRGLSAGRPSLTKTSAVTGLRERAASLSQRTPEINVPSSPPSKLRNSAAIPAESSSAHSKKVSNE